MQRRTPLNLLAFVAVSAALAACGSDGGGMSADMGPTTDSGQSTMDGGPPDQGAAPCGNGTLDPGEECDDGAMNSDTAPDACRLQCVDPECGDGVIDTGEMCDDAAGNSDTTPDACRTSCVPAECGDTVIDTGEMCDEGASNSDTTPNACRTNCVPAGCGDGILDSGESCDDGPNNSDTVPNACRTNCALADCGDGNLDMGETCDDGMNNSDTTPEACRTTCVPAFCGDGVIDMGETCDNASSNSDMQPDACRTNCVPAECGDGVIDTGETCDDAGANSDSTPDACRTNCEAAGCGDGVIDMGETCDDGAANSDTNADACRTSCVPASCGDGVLDAGEVCDDGPDGSATCSPTCRPAITFAQATASGSQSGYAVAGAIDGSFSGGSNGWAIDLGTRPIAAQTAVFELVQTPAGGTQGTMLTLTLEFNSVNRHNLGAFRFSTTEADRSQFADGMANGGDLGNSNIWTEATVVSATSEGGATLTPSSDYRIIASGAEPRRDRYTIVLITSHSAITGLRLEALEDASLPDNGPGRAGNGNFVLTELAGDAVALDVGALDTLANATASASQPSYSIAETINGVFGGGNDGWALDVGGGTDAETAVFEVMPAITSGASGSLLRITMHHQTLSSINTGRFRILVTDADPRGFADGMANGGNLGPANIWEPVEVVGASSGTLQFTRLPDGSLLVDRSAANPDYVVDVFSRLGTITGVRLEMLTDASLPTSGPGWSNNGNLVLSEFTVRSQGL